MSDRMLDLLAALDAAIGVSGDERLVADVIAAELDGHHDEHDSDALGNHFFTRRGGDGAPTVMLCAHMDELGFIVQHVEDEGFVRIAPVGYHDAAHGGRPGPRASTARRAPSTASPARSRPTSCRPTRRSKAIPIDQLHVDVGTTSRDETEALGVRVGDLATFARTGLALNGTRVFSGKAVDDRAGCAVMVEVMRRLGDSPAATVVGVAAVQEELGIRGAGPAATRVKPDVGIAIDVTLCGDTPGLEYSRLPISMGKGPAIKYFDWAPEAGYGSAVPRRLTDQLERAADAAGVAYQREVLLGGATDAWGIANCRLPDAAASRCRRATSTRRWAASTSTTWRAPSS